MLFKLLFLLVVLVTNVIQGITGFAGTVLAMPFSVMLIGFDTAKPILNVLGLLSGVYVLVTSFRHVNRREFIKITAVMLAGIIGGFYIRSFLPPDTKLFYIVLGVLVMAIGAVGLVKSLTKRGEGKKRGPFVSTLLLIASGVVHGLFVCGGPLLVGYMTGRVDDKEEFRATLSAVWIVLNGVIMIDDLRTGLWTAPVGRLLIPSVIALFAAMYIGSLLFKKMSRESFMKLTFVLLIISGASLLLK